MWTIKFDVKIKMTSNTKEILEKIVGTIELLLKTFDVDIVTFGYYQTKNEEKIKDV